MEKSTVRRHEDNEKRHRVEKVMKENECPYTTQRKWHSRQIETKTLHKYNTKPHKEVKGKKREVEVVTHRNKKTIKKNIKKQKQNIPKANK